MRLIKIEANENGSHDNITYMSDVEVPEGWAIVPDELGELENYPFGEIKTKKVGGITTVTKWTAGKIPREEIAPSRMREQAYNTERLIEWNGDKVTVTKASNLFMYYLSEGNTETCDKLKALISEAKQEIREKYPDESGTTPLGN